MRWRDDGVDGIDAMNGVDAMKEMGFMH